MNSTGGRALVRPSMTEVQGPSNDAESRASHGPCEISWMGWLGDAIRRRTWTPVDSSIVACVGVPRTNQSAEIPRIFTPGPQRESQPNEDPHYARGHDRGTLWRVAIPGENAIGVRVREKGIFSAECSGGQHREVTRAPQRGAWEWREHTRDRQRMDWRAGLWGLLWVVCRVVKESSGTGVELK
jgi:hypothetical protein